MDFLKWNGSSELLKFGKDGFEGEFEEILACRLLILAL
jgi:hypothetical protein